MEFVVHINGEDPAVGHWVLSVDAVGERFLLADADGAFRWVPMASCTFNRAANPDIPRMVVAVQPNPGLAVPQIRVGDGRGR